MYEGYLIKKKISTQQQISIYTRKDEIIFYILNDVSPVEMVNFYLDFRFVRVTYSIFVQCLFKSINITRNAIRMPLINGRYVLVRFLFPNSTFLQLVIAFLEKMTS